MKNLSSFILALLIIALITGDLFAACNPNTSTALEFIKGCAQDGSPVPISGSQDITAIKELVTKITERALGFGALFAVGAIVWSGIKYNTAYGDDERIKSAKSTAIYALIGLFLMLLAYPFVDLVINFIYSFSS